MLLLALVAITGLAAARPAGADTPPNLNDPCYAAGRDACHTTGVGQYGTYRYGTRWFGDYRGAVAGVSLPSFCIDLGYWYPGRAYDYALRSISGLRNRLGASVPVAELHRISYAIWQFGRSDAPDQQAAVMLYVHGLMGDAQPGELDASVLGAGVQSTLSRITAQAARYAGPYTVTESMPSVVGVGAPVKVRLAVRAASAADVPGVSFRIAVSGASGPARVTSGGSGVATLTVTPDGAGTVHVSASAAGLAADLPDLYVPTHGAAAASGQRLVVPTEQTLTAHAATTVSLAHLTIVTTATPSTLILGQTDADAVTISGAPAGYAAKVQIAMYGPAATRPRWPAPGPRPRRRPSPRVTARRMHRRSRPPRPATTATS